MIPTKTRYETHDGKLLAIIKAFKMWRYYLEGYKHKDLMLTDHNNFQHFMDTKTLSSRQVRFYYNLNKKALSNSKYFIQNENFKSKINLL